MEMLIEKTKENYYEVIQLSFTGWHESENSYEPFIKYYLGIMLKAYNEFESRVEHLKHRSLSKTAVLEKEKHSKSGKTEDEKTFYLIAETMSAFRNL